MMLEEDELHYWVEVDPRYVVDRVKQDLFRLRWGFEFESLEHRKAEKLAKKHNFDAIRIPGGVKSFYVNFYAEIHDCNNPDYNNN